MQTRKDDSVFPYNHEQEDGSFVSNPGLSKREYFAILALQGLLNVPFTDESYFDEIPAIAVGLANELIKALNVGEHGTKPI